MLTTSTATAEEEEEGGRAGRVATEDSRVREAVAGRKVAVVAGPMVRPAREDREADPAITAHPAHPARPARKDRKDRAAGEGLRA